MTIEVSENYRMKAKESGLVVGDIKLGKVWCFPELQNIKIEKFNVTPESNRKEKALGGSSALRPTKSV